MKTLKKTLCLVLAVVMVLGLGVMSASAKLEYTDNEKITYKEAVDVMSGIGVLKGDEAGFRPTDTVRRSEAAKILAYLLIGNAKQADALTTSSDPFTDVPSTHWAAGYIAYCVQRGIINGMGDGTFQPDSPVTGLQFAKMLLCAVGYNANGEYLGTDWSISVSKDALSLKIFNGNLGGATNTPATREECALYSFNTTTKVKKVSYSALLGGYIESNVFTSGAANEAKATIAGDFELYSAETEADAFGRPAGHHWYVNKSSNVISATYGDPNDAYGDVEDLKASYTTKVTGNDIYNLLGAAFIKDAKNKASDNKDVYGDFHLFVDGDEVANRYVAAGANATGEEMNLDSFTKGNAKTLDHTGNGVETNVYAWSSKAGDQTVNHIVITVVNTYLAKVDSVKAATSTKDPVTKVTLVDAWDRDYSNGQSAYPIDLDSKGFTADTFKEKDYVLVTAALNNNGTYTIQSMDAPTVVKSNVSRYNKSGSVITVTAGGTAYTAALNTANSNADKLFAANNTEYVNRNIVDGKDHTLYVDKYGYLVAAADVEAESDYVYVAQFGKKYDLNDKISDGDVLVADIYFADGHNEILTVDTEYNSDNTKYGSGDGVDDNKFYDKDGDDKTTLNNTKLGIYELTMRRGKAILTDGYNKTTVDANKNVTKGISQINTYRASNSTVFFYVHVPAGYTAATGYGKTGYTVKAYNGINAVPVSKDAANNSPDKVNQANMVCGILNDKNVYVAALVEDNFKAERGETVYFYTGVSYGVENKGDGTYGVTYLLYLDGKAEEIEYIFNSRDDAKQHYDDSNGLVNEFLVVKAGDKHEFDKITKSDDAIAKSKYDATVTILDTAKTDFDATTINNTYSYSAQDMVLVDTRDVEDEDDLFTSVDALRKAHDTGAVKNIDIAVKYADNTSKQISVMYIIDLTAIPEAGRTPLT